MTTLSPDSAVLYLADFPGRADVARLRLHAMDISASNWSIIAGLAADFGDGKLQVVDDGDIEFSGVTDTSAMAESARTHGLQVQDHIPGPTVAFSPMSGRSGGWADIHDLYTDLLAQTAQLPVVSWSPFLGLDDGRGDIAALGPTVGAIAEEPDVFQLILDGKKTDELLGWDTVVARLVREYQTRTAGQPQSLQRDLEIIDSDASVGALQPGLDLVGWLPQENGQITLGAGLRFGEINAEAVQLLARVDKPLTVTPWRSLMIHDLDVAEAEIVLRVLAPRGLVFDQESPWLRVSACPHCNLSQSNTLQDAEAAVHAGALPAGRVHFAGCDMRCGLPRGNFIEYLALADGEYEVSATG